MTHSLAQRFAQIDLYPVTCQPLSCGRSDEEVVQALLAGGAQVVQYRDKISSLRDRLQVAQRLRQLTRKHQALLIINDDVALAMAIGADGVHLGQEDLPCAEVRRLWGLEPIIGVSCHSLQDALQAESEGATYANIGPVFATQTKTNTCAPVGVALVQEVLQKVSLPITVMGGIHENNLSQVLQIGVRRVAMVSEVVAASDIAAKVKTLRQKIQGSL